MVDQANSSFQNGGNGKLQKGARSRRAFSKQVCMYILYEWTKMLNLTVILRLSQDIQCLCIGGLPAALLNICHMKNQNQYQM